MAQLTFLCVFDGDGPSSAFYAPMWPSKTVHNLSAFVKSQFRKKLRNVDADQITIWKVSIDDPGETDNQDLPILLDSIQYKNRLNSKTQLSAVFDMGTPPDNTIHLIFQALAMKSINYPAFEIYGQDQNKDRIRLYWSTIVETATLAELKKQIYYKYPHYACDDRFLQIGVPDRASTWDNRSSDYKTDVISDDEGLRTVLRFRLRQTESEPRFEIRISTSSKNFSSRSYKDVCDLYGLSGCEKLDSPQISSQFTDTFQSISSSSSLDFYPDPDPLFLHTVVKQNVITSIRLRYIALPGWRDGTVVKKSVLVDVFLYNAISIFGCDISLRPQGYLGGRREYAPIHTLVKSGKHPNLIVGGVTVVAEMRDAEFEQGIVQNVAQLESALLGRNVEEDGIVQDPAQLQSATMDDAAELPQKVYGIVTDSRTWVFLECMLDENRKISFRTSLCRQNLDHDDFYGFGEWKDETGFVLRKIVWLFCQMRDQIRT